MATYTNYRNTEEAIRNLENFKGNSAWGAWLDSSQYVVFSYSTEIGRYDKVMDKFTLNERKYSVTTSRLQNLIRRAWGL